MMYVITNTGYNYHKIIVLKSEDFRKFSADFRVGNISITPLHIITVNQQIVITKNVIWTILVSTISIPVQFLLDQINKRRIT